MLLFFNALNSRQRKIIIEIIDIYYTIIIGLLWIISTLWDIFQFHCYWSDYILEIISVFFITLILLYFLKPKILPKEIICYFGLITTTLGRGIIMLTLSLLFIGDKHIFHKLCSIFLFIGGILLTFLEIIPYIFPRFRKNFDSSICMIDNTGIKNIPFSYQHQHQKDNQSGVLNMKQNEHKLDSNITNNEENKIDNINTNIINTQ